MIIMTKKASKVSTENIADMVQRMMRRYRPVQVQCESPTLEGTLVCHINLLHSVLLRRANSAVDIEGMTLQQWLALGAVAHKNDEGIRHSELGQTLRLSKAPVTGMVDRLERAGWVIRKPDEQDRRAARIVVTAEGVSAWQRAQHALCASSQELFASLDETETYQLLSMLGSLLGKATELEDLPELAADEHCVGERHGKAKR